MAVGRIQARWLKEAAEPTEGDFDTKVVENLVETLDAHAQAYLDAVEDNGLLPAYEARLRHVGKLQIDHAEQHSLLRDPYSEDRLRRIAESSGEFIRRRASPAPAQQEHEILEAVERIRAG